MSDIDTLTHVLAKRFGHVAIRTEFGWPHPPLNVLDCILSLNRRYRSFVVPRVRAFAEHRPEMTELPHLRELIASYENPGTFGTTELNYNDAPRMQTIRDVTAYLIGTVGVLDGETEAERLHTWALTARPGDVLLIGIPGFGLAGFQYLRMLFGAQTAKPDVHIRNFVSEVIGRKVNDYTALALLEQASARANLPLREVDGAIWGERAWA
jgi:hypothetical protein